MRVNPQNGDAGLLRQSRPACGFTDELVKVAADPEDVSLIDLATMYDR